MLATMGPRGELHRRFPLLLGAIVALGLALRVASAQGSLWLDEAWSATLAHDTGTPLGVFLKINHDNNHHLNSLWLQFVGLAAPPVLARALSIATGTIAIWVAGRIGTRRGPAIGLTTAWLFAISPILVTMGSEARGYAPMLLALLVAVLLVDRWLAGETVPPRRGLAWCFGLGALSQLTIVFGVCALVGWVSFAVWRRTGWKEAVRTTLRLFGPALVTLAILFGMIIGAALASKDGFTFGRYDPFTLPAYLHGVGEMVGYTVGIAQSGVWLPILAVLLVLLAPRLGASRLAFHRLAIVGFPLAIAILHTGNVGFARYYLLAGTALLILIGEVIGLGLVSEGWKRWASGAALAALTVTSLARDGVLIANQRGDPGAAVRAMMARSPDGATLRLDRETGLAVIRVAAEHQRYPLTIVDADCPPARFVFIDRFEGQSFPAAVALCSRRYRPIASARARGLSGTDWTLYELQP
ncbi:hypothetical protein [Sphingomonas sp. DT-204]|uniref:hypothetical protein n=1 Tax=Sphingomonas sp. DT-204 TaxID=3396166 RepID=UPI003F198E86